MKPMIIIPPGQMCQADINELKKNDICVVIAKDPSRVKFVDPIPAISNRNEIENAAIKLSRVMLNNDSWTKPDGYWDAGNIAKHFVKLLVKGTALDSRGTKEEIEQEWYDAARRSEVERIAREDAKAERDAKKKALLESSLKTPEQKKP